MTTLTLSTSEHYARRPVLRRLILAAGLALVAWADRDTRSAARTHAEQSRLLHAESARESAARLPRYGFHA